ncbi:hypothetical protein QBE52_14255 [Clostridiaceae bacterium 35-E11]
MKKKKSLQSIKIEIEKLTLLMKKNLDIDEKEIKKLSRELDQLLRQYKMFDNE